jgi:uncharacterized protein
MNTEIIAQENKIFETLSGSRAYGMARPESDTDYRGIFIAPKENVITGLFTIDQWIDPNEDRTLYELRKFMKLLSAQNPNIIELLWVRDEDIITRTPEYDYLRENREMFLSSKARYTFAGYAFSQLKRIKGHNKWLNNPKPEKKPQMKDYVRIFGGKDHGDILGDNHNGLFFQRLHGHVYTVDLDNGSDKKLYTRSGEMIIAPGKIDDHNNARCIATFDRDAYEHDKNDWQGYWDWNTNRNKVRHRLEKEHGFDTKHASHLIRLLRMGSEILNDGVVNVYRPDAEELLDIRRGKYSYDEIIKMSDGLMADIETSYETTKLRRHVDNKMVSKIILNMYEMYWRSE